MAITEGPLKGREAMIRKIDRHQRKAIIEIMMFGKMQELKVALDVVEVIG